MRYYVVLLILASIFRNWLYLKMYLKMQKEFLGEGESNRKTPNLNLSRKEKGNIVQLIPSCPTEHMYFPISNFGQL